MASTFIAEPPTASFVFGSDDTGRLAERFTTVSRKAMTLSSESSARGAIPAKCHAALLSRRGNEFTSGGRQLQAWRAPLQNAASPACIRRDSGIFPSAR
jgi:hypothetical protein